MTKLLVEKTGSEFGSAAVHVRGPIVRITAMVTVMTIAMATLLAMMLHSTPSSICSFPRSNRCTLVALRRVAAAASGSEAVVALPASSVRDPQQRDLCFSFILAVN